MENLYIVLDGNNATLADNDTSLYWTIPDHYFKNMKDPQGKVNLSLVSAIFTCSTTTLFTVDTESCEILTDLQLSNSMNTNSLNTLAIVDTLTSFQSPNDIIVSLRSNLATKLDLEVSKFTSIKIQIKKQNVLCDFTAIANTVDKSYCKFILNLKYPKY
jgi:hypothetical protein